MEMKQSEIFKVKKRVYEVEVCRLEIGCQVWNYMENTFYIVDETRPFVIRGMMGEEWLIDEENLKRTYCKLDGNEIDCSGLTRFFTKIKTKAMEQFFGKYILFD